MPSPRHTLVLVVCAYGLLAAGCASTVGTAAVVTAPPEAPAIAQSNVTVAHVAVDPVDALIALSNSHFDAGRRELDLGHLDLAKAAFNRALDVLLETPGGARTDPRLREHFDLLVERESALELTALAKGDGFAEKESDPASIDDLLALSIFDDPDASEATKQAVSDDLASHDIEIPLNDRVLAYVELFTGRLKGYLTEGLQRGARFLPMIQDVFRAEGLPLDLAYVPLVESAFKPTALSRAKAKGIWQFMQGTALENGLKHDWYIDERAEPEKSTRAAARYLKTLYGMFGDWHLALASYNGGPGRVQRAIKASGRDDFWSLSSSSRYLPQETRDYVPLILAAMIIARNPAQYGIDMDPLESPRIETVTLQTATDIRRIAEWAGAPVETIQNLNPELRRWTTPVGAGAYELKVPEGTATIITERLAQASPDELATLSRYAVRKGDTLSAIAKRLKVSRADLAGANYLSTSARVRPGQELVIPRESSRLLALRTDGSEPPDTVVPASNVASRRQRPEASKTVYRVKRGDTLYSIAKIFDTTVASLKSWNRLRGSSLQVGQRLTVFTNRNATH